MNPLFRKIMLSLALLGLLSTPLAAAASTTITVEATSDVVCPSILVAGVVAFLVCVVEFILDVVGGAVEIAIQKAKEIACIAWRLLWGQDEPCPA